MASKNEAIKLAIQWFEWFLALPGSDDEPSHNSTYVLKKLKESIQDDEK